MAAIFLTTLPDGRLAIIKLNGPDSDGTKLAKSMFELSRDGDMTNHFDPSITLADIAAGLPGHTSLVCRGIVGSNLPSEQALRGIEPTFRDAWEDTGTSVQVSMLRARVIHMDRIRQARDPALKELDISYMQALEAGDSPEQQRIATLKQALRDLPTTFDLNIYPTPKALKAAWPAELPPR